MAALRHLVYLSPRSLRQPRRHSLLLPPFPPSYFAIQHLAQCKLNLVQPPQITSIHRYLKPIVLTGIILTALIFASVVVFLNFRVSDLTNRALIIVSESNGSLTREDREFYSQHKTLVDFVLTSFLGVPGKDLETDDLSYALNTSVDVGLANLLSGMAKGYGKIIILTGEDAAFAHFVQVVNETSAAGWTTDIVTFIHGSQGFLYFKSQLVPADLLPRSIESSRLGYVYQINCDGQSISQAWMDSGAQVVSGSAAVNSMVLISPGIFQRLIAWGVPFDRAASISYRTEVFIWKIVGRVVPGIYWNSQEAVNSSRPVISGNAGYKL